MPATALESSVPGVEPGSPAAQAELLRGFIEDVSGDLDIDSLLSRTIVYACRLTGAKGGFIALYEERRHVLRSVAVYGMPDMEIGAERPPGVGLAGQVLASGRLVTGRYGDIPGRSPLVDDETFVAGMPIVASEELVGFIGIGVPMPGRFTEADLALLTAFARHAGIAIRNARRFARERRRTARFELISKVTRILGQGGLSLPDLLQQAADAVHEVLEYPNVDIPLLDPRDPNVLVVEVRGGDYKRQISGADRLPVAVGIMGAAVRERRAQLVNDVRLHPAYVKPPVPSPSQAELAVPILAEGQVLGVVNVEGDGPFDELDVKTIEVVAMHLGVAIESARRVAHRQELALREERQRLAFDLHDSVTQALSGISLLAQALPATWAKNPGDGQATAARLADLAALACGEMRGLLEQLAPKRRDALPVATELPQLGMEHLRDGGLVEALPALLRVLVPPSINWSCSWRAYVRQSLALEEVMLRVCQEAAANVVRHAGAACLRVMVAARQRHVLLRITDDGCGFGGRPMHGYGLESMRSRVERTGGQFRTSRQGKPGAEIVVTLPREDWEGAP